MLSNLLSLSRNFLLAILKQNRNNHNLQRSNPGRDNQTLIITVVENHRADTPRRETPTVLIRQSTLTFLIQERNAKTLGKTLTKMMACSSLHCLARRSHCFNTGRIISTSKLLIIRLFALNDRNCKQFLKNTPVQLKNIKNFLFSLSFSRKSSMTLLPQEFPAPQERNRMLKLPTQNITPLIKTKRQITITTNPLSIRLVHNSFRSRSYCQTLLKLSMTAHSNPGNLRSKTLNVLSLLVKQAFWY
ncbi:Uncharacterised protein [uncultured archaeon]|nr:Uncharacterised protein [uncultured archaeon]